MLITFRNKMREFYASYDIYILPIVRLALAFVTFFGISNMLGYVSALNNMIVLVVLAVICAFLPWNAMAVIGILLIIAHSFGLGLEVGAIVACLYLIMLLFYFRFVPDDGLALILVPLTCFFRVPMLVPLCLGLRKKPVSALSAALGIFSWYMIRTIVGTVATMKADSENSVLDIVKGMLDSILHNDELWIALITSIVVVLVVAGVRKLVTTYAWGIAVAAGCAVYVLMQFLGGLLLGVDIQLVVVLLNAAASAAAGLILGFFVFTLDYKGSQYMQFEDDEYYYYIKAIPKIQPEEEEGDVFEDIEDDEEY